MFDDFDCLDFEDEVMTKKMNMMTEDHVKKECKVVHSSLDYNTIKVPPLVEYNSVYNYCEKNGERVLKGVEPLVSSVKRVCSPVVLKTPQPTQPKTPLPSRDCQPFCFFSIEELSLVKSLNNWNNRKVCTIGKLVKTRGTDQCYLCSVTENGSWMIVLDALKVKLSCDSRELLQVYGILDIHEEKSKIIVSFVRKLEAADTSLFVKSYELVQKYIPKFIGGRESCGIKETYKLPYDDDSIHDFCSHLYATED